MIRKYIKKILGYLSLYPKLLLQKLKIRNFFIWQGLYSHYEQVKVKKSSWGNDIMEKDYSKSIKKSLDQIQPFMPVDISEENILLPILVATYSTKVNPVTIVDFGGGAGISYIQLKRCLSGGPAIEYHIVETESMVKHSREIFPGNTDIFFHTTIPNNLKNVDIVFISSTLQYLKNYEDILKKLGQLNATYIFLVKLSAGDFPTYYTKQVNEKNCEMPYIFLNYHEIIHIMEKLGYSLTYKSFLSRRYNQENFPKELRMHRTSNFLFQKKHVNGKSA